MASEIDSAFHARKPLIGMVHLLPLPGSPRGRRGAGALEEVIVRAVEDAQTLERGGMDAVMVENFFDAPFWKSGVPPHTVAAMTAAVQAVRAAVRLPVGVNVLRNDVRSALAVAHVCGGAFVRCNVYVGAAVTDQGIIEGAAREAVSYLAELGADVRIWADVAVKHAAPLGAGDPAQEARDATERGLADAIIVTGAATGAATPIDRVRAVKAAVPKTPVLVGSGLTAETARELLAVADGAIVGSSLKRDGQVAEPVALDRVQALVEAVRGA